ncbi:MAG: hypothetical protein AB2693_31080 [Candidatus Thiodiazotropha sp.]
MGYAVCNGTPFTPVGKILASSWIRTRSARSVGSALDPLSYRADKTVHVPRTIPR